MNLGQEENVFQSRAREQNKSSVEHVTTLPCRLNRRMPNGMYGGVRGAASQPLLDCMTGMPSVCGESPRRA